MPSASCLCERGLQRTTPMRPRLGGGPGTWGRNRRALGPHAPCGRGLGLLRWYCALTQRCAFRRRRVQCWGAAARAGCVYERTSARTPRPSRCGCRRRTPWDRRLRAGRGSMVWVLCSYRAAVSSRRTCTGERRGRSRRGERTGSSDWAETRQLRGHGTRVLSSPMAHKSPR